MKTVVLAYSGGLDTSVRIPLLKERYDYDKVITVVADVGQPAPKYVKGMGHDPIRVVCGAGSDILL
jgi:argininosuccinate synthase